MILAEKKKMALTRWQYYCIIFVSIFLLVHYGGRILVANTHGHEKGNLRRIVVVVRAELLMLLLSAFIYKRIMSLFDVQQQNLVEVSKQEGKADKDQAARFRKGVSAGVLLWLTLSHLMYFTFYLPKRLRPVLFYPAAISLGVWTNLGLLMLGFSLLNFLSRLIESRPWGAALLRPLLSCQLLKSLLLCPRFQIKTALYMGALLSVVTMFACDRVVVKQVEIELKGLPGIAKGMRFGLVTDMHVGGSVTARQVQAVVDLCNEEFFDAIFIVGDLVDGVVEDLGVELEALKNLKSKYGTYYVTGNHDYYYGNVDDWIDFLTKHRVRVLRNENVDLNGICLVGVDDLSSQNSGVPSHVFDYEKAVKGCRGDRPIIALAHNPNAALNITKLKTVYRPVDLILSGHLHAGQFYVMAPIIYWLFPYFYGLYRLDNDSQLLVSAGTLHQGPPMKMVGLSEIWSITVN